MTPPSKFDSQFAQPTPSQRAHIWTLPPAPRGPVARLWDRLVDRVAAWFGPHPPVVEPPEWFARAQADSRLDVPVDPPRSDPRRAPVQPRPSLPTVNLPG